ncbi:AraC family transcriptional regulator [Bacteroidales bacterium OttesenSCG-928-A17]|nr:AraC family transcriptional regulator [Bacteroidales bacterium OttesenSCG-928-A17]
MKLLKTLFAFLLLISFSFSAQAQNEDPLQQKKDSLLHIIATTTDSVKMDAYWELTSFLFDYEMRADTAVKYYEKFEAEAIKQKDIKMQAKIKANMMLALYNRRKYTDVIDRAPVVLNFLHEQESWMSYCIVYNNVVMAYFLSGQREKAIEEANLFHEQAKAIGNPYASISSMRALGRLYFNLHYYKEAAEYFEAAINEAEKDNDNNAIRNLKLSIYTTLSDIYVYLEEYEKTDVLFKQWEKDILEKEKRSPRNLTDWINFYSYNLNLWNRRMDAEKSEYYCNLLEGLGVKTQAITLNILNGRWHIAYIKKNYAQAVSYANEILKIAEEGNDLNKIYSALTLKTNALCRANMPEDCLRTFGRMTQVKDSIRSLEISAQLDELRTQHEVDRHIAEKEILRHRWFIAITACILLLIALLIYILYSRRLKQKNRMLYNQVQELNRKEKAVESCLFARPEESLSKEMQLFKKISEYMRTEKPFINPELNRKTLADALGTNEKYLADAIKAGTGEILSEYFANVRLQYALELLDGNSEMTLESIALDSGHGSYSQFFRSFSKKYGISPSEYRKIAQG